MYNSWHNIKYLCEAWGGGWCLALGVPSNKKWWKKSILGGAQCPVRKTISKMSKIVLTKTELFIFYVQIYIFNFGNVSFLQKCIFFVFCSQLKPKLLLVWQKSNLLAITLLVIFTFFTVVIRALFDTIMSQANSGDSWFNFHNCDTQFLFHFYLN